MKRRKYRKLKSTKDQKIACNDCSKLFLLAQHFKQHFTKDPRYNAAQMFRCLSYQYIGHNGRLLVAHMQYHKSCKYTEKQKEVTSCFLPNTSSVCIIQHNISPYLLSFTFKQYSTDGIVDNVKLNIKNEARIKRKNVRKLSDG